MNVYFIKEVQWYNASFTQAEEAVCVSFLPCHPVCIVFVMPHKLRILVDLWRIGTQRVTKWVQGKHVTSMTDLVEVVTAPRGYAFHLNQNLLQKEQKEGNGSLRNTSDQRTPSYPFLLVGVTSRYDDFHYKWWHRRKGKNRAIHSSFSFPSFFPQLGRMHAYQERKQKQSSWSSAAFTLFW